MTWMAAKLLQRRQNTNDKFQGESLIALKMSQWNRIQMEGDESQHMHKSTRKPFNKKSRRSSADTENFASLWRYSEIIYGPRPNGYGQRRKTADLFVYLDA